MFLLEYGGTYQAWIGYKESAASGNTAFKVNRYYHTDWMMEADLPLKIEGLSVDAVYENFVRQIAGETLHSGASETLKESVARDACRTELQKQIASLQVKVRREKQLNKQVQLNTELKRLKKELEEI